MPKKRLLLSSIAIWILAAGSLVGIRFLLHRKPSLAEPVAEAQAMIRSLDDQHRKSLRYDDAGLIRLGDDSFHLVGNCPNSEETNRLTSQKADIRKIDFRIEDQLSLERQTMVREAIRTLNNAEKKCLFE